MKKLSLHLIKELSSLSDTIPTGFKGLFSKASGLWVKKSDNSESRLLTTDDIINADLLDGLHASDFAKANTAFTQWYNIPSNAPYVHIYVLNAVSHSDLYLTVSNIEYNDHSDKVFILQPGTYFIDTSLCCSTQHTLGFIGLSKYDTFIDIHIVEAITEVKFVENITFNIASYPDDPLACIIGNNTDSYLKSVNMTNQLTESGTDINCFSQFTAIENVLIMDCNYAFSYCRNISNVNINIPNVSGIGSNSIFYSCDNISNVDIYFSEKLSAFSVCNNISNFRITSDNSRSITAMSRCNNISNGSINNFEYGLINCTNISNVNCNNSNIAFSNSSYLSDVTAQNGEMGFDRCTHISNCYAATMSNAGFSECSKLSASKSDSCYYGFSICNGIINNLSINSTITAYDSCYADMNTTYSVADTPSGGWNA